MLISEDWITAQQAVIGSMLIDCKAIPLALNKCQSADFTPPQQILFDTIRQMFVSRGGIEGIDPVSILAAVPEAEFHDRKQLRDYILQLMEITPTAANVERYADLCRQHRAVAQIQETARALLETKDLARMRELLGEASAAAMDRRDSRVVGMKAAMVSFFERLSSPRRWLKWPFPGMNQYIFARPGDFIILGAESSVGKTAMALQLATYWSRCGKRVGFFSFETDEEDITDRLMAGFMGVNMYQILRGNLTDADYRNAAQISMHVSQLPFTVIDASGMTVADISARTLIEGFDIILIDYLQLITPESGHTRAEEVAKISRALKHLGRSTKTTVIALSQLRRDEDQQHPTNDRLLESGQLRNDADIIILLSLEDKKDQGGQRRFQVSKNKRGKLTWTVLNFDGGRQLFFDPIYKEPPVPDWCQDGTQEAIDM